MRKLLCVLMLTNSYAFANGTDALTAFFKNKNSTISANFSQTVFGNKKNTTTTGTMKISRPNRFRWQYDNDGQLIVCNGKVIDIYDKPLKQVTEKKLNGSLGKSPALLLAGGSDINNNYIVKNEPDSSQLDWVLLTPKNPNDNNGFKSIEMGFNKTTQDLSQMKFVDSFDNKSMINFSNVKTGIVIPDSQFQFVVPSGVDVIKSDSN